MRFLSLLRFLDQIRYVASAVIFCSVDDDDLEDSTLDFENTVNESLSLKIIPAVEQIR